MGNNASANLYRAARQGSTDRMQAALAEGADLNWKNSDKFDQTPLHAAAKHGRLEAVRLLLRLGAMDFRTTHGETALHVAAKMGHHGVVALLLDRGSDHHARDKEHLRPIDKASNLGHTAVVRLIEARTCPFVGHLEVERAGWFTTYYDKVWIAVARARPWDNPNVDRRAVSIFVYTDVSHARDQVEIVRPVLQPLNGTAIVEFEIRADFQVKNGRRQPHKVMRAKLPRSIYAWLSAVVSETFASGRGPAFDPGSGLILTPRWGQVYLSQFNTTEWTATRNAPPVEALPYPVEEEPTGPAGLGIGPTTAVRGTNGGVAQPAAQAGALPGSTVVPASALLAAASMLHHQQQSQPTTAIGGGVYPSLTPGYPGGVPGAVHLSSPAPTMAGQRPLPSAPPAVDLPSPAAQRSHQQREPVPAYWTAALERLQQEVADGSLTTDTEPPEQYVCPITADLLIDPVVASDGHTYSREGIKAWLALKRTSPKTNEVMNSDQLFPNHLLRGEVLGWIDAHRVREGQAQQVQQRQEALEVDPELEQVLRLSASQASVLAGPVAGAAVTVAHASEGLRAQEAAPGPLYNSSTTLPGQASSTPAGYHHNAMSFSSGDPIDPEALLQMLPVIPTRVPEQQPQTRVALPG